MNKQTSKYPEVIEEHYDLVSEPQYDMYFNNGEDERREEGTLRVLSLFSGCGEKNALSFDIEINDIDTK